jgi:hypothetical protein
MGRNQLRKPAGVFRIFHLAFSSIEILRNAGSRPLAARNGRAGISRMPTASVSAQGL